MLDFLRNTLYIRLSSELLSILQVESDCLFADAPYIALRENRNKKEIIGYGRTALDAANGANVTIANGFKHPRTIIADFSVADITLRYFVNQAQKNIKFKLSPIVIMHPIDEAEGGLTQIEIRALRELCSMAGARQVYVWQGRELSKNELKTLTFPSTAGKLLC